MLATGMATIGVSQKAVEASKTAKCPSTLFDFWDMAAANVKGGFPDTPSLQLMYGLRGSLNMLFKRRLDNVFARHHRIASGARAAVDGRRLQLCAKRHELYSNSVSAMYVSQGFNSDALTNHVFDTYGVSFGVGLGQMAGRAFRIGHLGSLTDVMAPSGISTVEIAMADLGYPIELGSGAPAAQECYRQTARPALRSAA